MEVDRGDADLVEAHRRHVRHGVEREAGQVVTVGESMERHIEMVPVLVHIVTIPI